MRELDSGVGAILNYLEQLKIDSETLVIFSSDNGGATYAKELGVFSLTPLSVHSDTVFMLTIHYWRAWRALLVNSTGDISIYYIYMCDRPALYIL